jgi:hypothetical protein
MSNYDEIMLGVGNSLHPANQEETNYDPNGYEALANTLFNEKMEWMKKAITLEVYIKEIKFLADGMADRNGLATIISNLLKDVE